MKISIITPTFNSEKNIEKNVTSVINQKYKCFEHIIIDNLSKDNTLSTINKIYQENNSLNSLRIICEQDNGISDAFNKGIRAAKGNIIAILNSDDYYYDSDVFEKVNLAFKKQNLLFTHGDIKFIDNTYGTNIRKPLLCKITKAMPYNHPTIFFRKDVYNDYGFFNTSYKYAMDYELILRLETTIKDFRSRGLYLAGNPITVQLAGGESWQNELNSIEEVKKALMEHSLWSAEAEKYFRQRVFRTKLKKWLTKFNLNFIVKIWRTGKWQY